MVERDSSEKTERAYAQSKPSKFRFKDSSKRRSRRVEAVTDNDEESDRERKRHRSEKRDHTHRRHRDSSRSRRRRRHRSPGYDGHPTSTKDGTYYDPDYRHRESLYDDLYDEAKQSSEMASDEAFRESLFDALADDEGAAYWEGVYGQPVHIYPDHKSGPDGKLERMTEEEYADYVRTKMWEKSHQHIVEEREARKRAYDERKKQRQSSERDLEREETEREWIRSQMAESLKRGEERKKAKQAMAAWGDYTRKWDEIKTTQDLSEKNASEVRRIIPWPVVSGDAKEISKDAIKEFLSTSSTWKEDRGVVLKTERVRWHPDKMQQRFGQHVDTETMKSVTAVFQIIDQLWNDLR